jgi:hypothetical protein
VLTCLALLAATVAPAHAQVIAFDPYGGLLRGYAAVIRARGDLLLKVEEAKQAQLVTRRRVVEQQEWEYERLNPVVLREKYRKLSVERAKVDPPDHEIESGISLNTLLVELRVNSLMRDQSRAIPVEPTWLKDIHFTSGQVDRVGILLHDKLFWPFLLRQKDFADERKEIDDLVKKVKYGASVGSMEVEKIQRIEELVKTMQTKVVERNRMIKSEDWVFSDDTAAKDHLRQLTDAVKGLKNEQAGEFLSGKLSAAGANVQELVQDMLNKGLRFAPATNAQSKRIYHAVYNALARAVREGTGPETKP